MIFQFLSEILNFGITFTADLKDDQIDYIDSNYEKLINKQKSTDNYIVILSGRLLSHQLKL